MKVFGIGLQKTGTTTLGACLKQFGYKHLSYDHDSISLLRKGDYELLFEKIDDYDSFEDQPWASLYKEVDLKYPDSKFILTIRKDSFAWFETFCRHCNRIPWNEHRKFFFGYDTPYGHREHYINVYETHNDEVKKYFKDRPEKLLVVCWELADGWKELCSFLSKEFPDIPLPHKNKAPFLNSRTISRITNTLKGIKRHLRHP